MQESDELYLLRFRYGRTAEIYQVYLTFLNRQVIIGDKKCCRTEEHVRQATHTLLLTFYSFIHSLFDKSGTDFIKISEPYHLLLSEKGKTVRTELIEVWENNKTAIEKIRNNIGFHGGQKIKSHETGYAALLDLHPQTAHFIMNQLALLFLEFDILMPPKEDYSVHLPPNAKIILLKIASDLKEKMTNNQYANMVDRMKAMFGGK